MKKILSILLCAFFLTACSMSKREFSQLMKSQKASLFSIENVEIEKYMEFSRDAVFHLEWERPYAIFFHGSECKSCQEMDVEIKANLDDLPEKTVVLKVEYGGDKTLEDKYGVLYPNTMVFIDDRGQPVKSKVKFKLKDIQKYFE